MDFEYKIRAWCALNRAPRLGNKSFSNLLAAFGSPEAFFGSPDAEIKEKISSISWQTVLQWKKFIDAEEVQADLNWLMQDLDHRAILTLHDDRYPALLKQISDPPPVLFVQGDVDLLPLMQLGVVGSRQSTPQGEQICADLCSEIAKFGLVITSGLALGIDAAAHRAALSVSGKTIAVVGTGLDRVYPAQNLELAYQIAETGAIVSEFPIGVGVRAHHFPQRNRVISGLSAGVLVVEASVKSGSLITARQAGEQGREVFAVPGSILNPMSRGCHALIKSGAKLTECADDILEELRPILEAQKNISKYQDNTASFNHASSAVSSPSATPNRASVSVDSSATHTNEKQPSFPVNPPVTVATQNIPDANNPDAELKREILSAMSFDPCRIDDLVSRLKKSAQEISSILMMLELDGDITSLSGGRYQRVKA
ncbi:MAG: DNA-processing protein DprA [Cardiobacteriaceae bacterium]|nr:DNA-processing protein DprA [Cardiobacteriaceae bacterium]